MTDIAVNWSLYDTCIPHNPADGPRGRRVSTDCRGRLGGTGGSPTFQLILLRSQICVASHAIFGKKPYQVPGASIPWEMYKCRTQRTAAKVVRGPRQKGGDLQPVTVDCKQAGDGERRE